MLNIIVSIKQVPDTTEVRIDPVTNTLIREGVPVIINPFDENAIEEGLRLRERYGGKVTVITMGPPQAENALREALAMGVDDAILISERNFAGADTLATSYTLACAIKKIGDFDVLLFGKQAIDGDTAQVGPGVAEHIGIPEVAYVRKIEEINNGIAKVQRIMEDGSEIIEVKLPALFTVIKQINEPRLPSLKGKLMAKKKEIPVWKVEDIDADINKVGLKGSPTKVIKTFTPTPRGRGEILKGTVDEQVSELVTRLQELKLL